MESTQGDLDVGPQLPDTSSLRDVDETDRQDPRQSAADVQEKLEMDTGVIDQLDVDSIKDDAKGLKPREDKLAPINCLPVEILSTIFELVGDTNSEPDSRSSLVVPPFGLTRVSSRWRGIALATPKLWRRIPSANLRFYLVECLLRWSDSMPLHVSISPNCDRKDELIVQHGNRWQRVFVTCLPENAPSIFRFPAPLLEVLRIEAFGSTDAIYKIPEESPFPGIVPKLTHLRLVAVYLPLDCLRYSSLTELFISHIKPHTYPISQLLSILEASPHIQSVTLTTLIFSADSVSDRSGSSLITLPRLLRLELGDISPWAIHRILSCIQTPRDMILQVDVHGDADIGEILPRHDRSPPNIPTLSHIDDLTFYVADTSRMCVLVGYLGRQSKFLIQLGSNDDGFTGRTLSNLDQYFSLPPLFLLEFHNLETFPLTENLDNLPPAKTLKLCFCSVGAIEALISPGILPRLETLILDGCDSLTDEVLLRLAQSRTSSSHESLDRVPLQYLEVIYCSKVTEAGCLELESYLRVKHVQGRVLRSDSATAAYY